jgi:ligand-binding sensor domain-containing protein
VNRCTTKAGSARRFLMVAAIEASVITGSVGAGDLPVDPVFNIVKPSTTGVPGEEVRVMTVDPDGNLWIAGRWPFWFECGLAMLPAEEMEFSAAPGSGFDTGKWRVWSNVHHPIPSVYIDDIEFTPDGIMWIASEGGLTRFDRFAATPEEKWQTWNGANSPLTVDGVSEIDSDSDGRLWLVNSQVNGPLGKLFEFDPASESWTEHPLSGGFSSVTVGFDGNVYVTHETKAGFSFYNGIVWTHQTAGASFGSVLQDFDGNLWFISGNGGFTRWNGSTYKTWANLGGTSTITGLSLGLDGTVYVSTWYGPVFEMVGDTPVFLVDAEGLPRSVIQRRNGDLFINNYGSTLALGRVRHYGPDLSLLRRMNTYNSGLPDYFIDNIQTDNDGNLWFACGEGGLSRMLGSDGSPENPTRWRNWGNHNDFAEPYPWAGNEPMYSMYEDSDGFIWMGGNGIGKWDPDRGQFIEFWNWQNSSLGVDSFIRIIQDSNGEMWAFSDYTGGYHLNPATNDWDQKLFGAAWTTANYVNDVARDIDGNLWVTTDVALHFYNGSQWFAIGSFHGSPVEWPTAVEADPAGGVWIGADNGIIHYKDAQWTIFDMSNAPLPANHVHGLAVRADGLLAAAVAEFGAVTPFPNGVALFDGTNWQVYSYGDYPLPHYQLGDVEFDADGDVWVSTISEGVTEIVLHESRPIKVPGELSGDGVVDGADLGILLSAWGECIPGEPCTADLSGDGIVDGVDLGTLLANWG